MDDKERLRLAKEALGSGSYDKETVEYIFPELKESEDERIKEDIISYIQLANQFIPQFQKDKWIAWLKKQGEDEYIDPDTLIQQRLDALADIVADQKPTNKVEPKFHEGDLVVDNCGYVWKIEGILNQFYLLEGVEGGESRPTIEWVNKTFHLWTIQDAKDGDVLVADNGLAFIYNGYLEEQQWPFAYGGINIYGRFNICDGLLPFTHQKVVPATKEQRDALIKAMTNAGYEWDTEKKELKKIEQTPTWSEEDEKMIDAIYSCVDSHYDGLAKTSLLIWLKSLKPQNTWKPSDEH